MQYFLLILPVILVVLTGTLFRYKKTISYEGEEGLAAFVLKAAVPSLIFIFIASEPLHLLLRYWYIAGYLFSILSIFIVVLFVFRLVLQKTLAEASFAALNASLSNSVLIGLPILLGAIGKAAMVPVAITVFCAMVFLVPAFSLIIESTLSKEVHPVKIINQSLIATIKNPLVYSALIGLFFVVCHLPVPKWLGEYFHFLGDATVPCALVIVGMQLYDIRLEKKDLLEVGIIALCALAIRPIISGVFALSVHMKPTYAVALVITSALPTAKTPFILSKKYKCYEHETATSIVVTTIGAAITVPIVLYFCNLIWPGVVIAINW